MKGYARTSYIGRYGCRSAWCVAVNCIENVKDSQRGIRVPTTEWALESLLFAPRLLFILLILCHSFKDFSGIAPKVKGWSDWRAYVGAIIER